MRGAHMRRKTRRDALTPRSSTKVRGQSFANVGEQRQMVHSPAFAADDDLAGPPANVVKFEGDDFSAAQTEPSKQEQNRLISAPTECRSVHRRQNTFYFIG